MSEHKFYKGILCGAVLGGAISLLDRQTRDAVVNKSRVIRNEVSYYSKNREELKTTLEDQMNKWKAIYEQFSSDAKYLSNKVNEVKEITPQVKNLLAETKDTFSHSKEEYKTLVAAEEEPKSIYEPKG